METISLLSKTKNAIGLLRIASWVTFYTTNLNLFSSEGATIDHLNFINIQFLFTSDEALYY